MKKMIFEYLFGKSFLIEYAVIQHAANLGNNGVVEIISSNESEKRITIINAKNITLAHQNFVNSFFFYSERFQPSPDIKIYKIIDVEEIKNLTDRKKFM